jgi:hypothetical protein
MAAPAAAQTIDLVTPWDGTTGEGPFGQPNAATVGENFTVTATEPISSLVFEVGNCSAAIVIRAHIWRWDPVGAHATTAIYDSPQVLVNTTSGFGTVLITTPGLSLTAGDYIAFISTSQDQAGPSASCEVGTPPSTTFAGGQLQVLFNGADPSLWSTSTWSDNGTDLAFQLNVGAAVPAMPAWLMLTSILASLAAGAWALGTRARRVRVSR